MTSPVPRALIQRCNILRSQNLIITERCNLLARFLELNVMIIRSRMIEIPKEYKKVVEMTQGAIEDKHSLKFFYESKNGNKGERIIRPYMIILRGKILELVGLPTTELSKPRKERQAGHYTISQLKERLEAEEFEVLSETFDDPGVLRKIVDNTQTTPVFRFIYDDEIAEQVKEGWLQIKYI